MKNQQAQFSNDQCMLRLSLRIPWRKSMGVIPHPLLVTNIGGGDLLDHVSIGGGCAGGSPVPMLVWEWGGQPYPC